MVVVVTGAFVVEVVGAFVVELVTGAFVVEVVGAFVVVVVTGAFVVEVVGGGRVVDVGAVVDGATAGEGGTGVDVPGATNGSQLAVASASTTAAATMLALRWFTVLAPTGLGA